jgi:hypothetical protein
MNSQTLRTIHPSHADLDFAEQDVRRLISIAANRNDIPRREAVKVVSRHTGISAGTIENLERGRLKNVAGWQRDRLRAQLIKELHHEIMALETELQLTRMASDRPDTLGIAEVESAIAKAKQILAGEMK